MRPLIASLLGAGLWACSSTDPFIETVEPMLPERGAVVAEHYLATKAGLLILEAGGNAADAAVAAALTLAVVYPQAGNLGGGGFALWVPRQGPPESLDFREIAPRAVTADLYLDENGEVVKARSLATPLAVGIPGSPFGLFELYRKHGSKRFSFAQLCEGAIQLASGGFAVDPWLEDILSRPETRVLLSDDPGARELFYPDGKALVAGDKLVQTQLAKTLRLLARRGPAGFYAGDVAAAIVEDLEDADVRAGRVAGDALMDREDLASYRCKWRPPLAGVFRGHQIIGMGPPSSGGVALLQMTGMLEGLPLDVARREALREVDLGLTEPLNAFGPAQGTEIDWTGLDARGLHWWIEAMRRAFADRAVHLGDPDHVPVPIAALLSTDWIAERRVSIGDRANVDIAAWAPGPLDDSDETTHVSVIDDDGNAVSLTTTLNGSFGSGIYVDRAGFLLNNELDDFSIVPGTPNAYGLVGSTANQLAPLRRPLSSMCPIVVRNPRGDVALVLGAPGGPRIITAVTQVLLRVLVYEQSIVDAIRAPRVHQQWRPKETRVERGFDPRVLEELSGVFGQPLLPPGDAYFGSVQGIHVLDDGAVHALSDPRRGGAAGFEGEDPAEPAAPPKR